MIDNIHISLYAIASQLSPRNKSSGIQLLEADNFKLHAFQTLTGLLSISLSSYSSFLLAICLSIYPSFFLSNTGIKFVVVTDLKRNNEEMLLKKLYEIYSDYALKNPFYSIDMPIRFFRCLFFYQHHHRFASVSMLAWV